MGGLISSLASWLVPIVRFFVFAVPVLAFILGVIGNPKGFINQALVGAINMVAVFFPSTPEQFKISTIANNLGASMPIVGAGIFREILSGMAGMAALFAVFKIWKMIPFKAT